MTEELQITTGIDYNKHDVVTVAMAKIEAKIRENVRNSKSLVKSFEEAIPKAKKEIANIGERNIPKGLLTKEDVFKKAIAASKLGKNIVAKIICDIRGENNLYNLGIFKFDTNGDTKEGITISSETTSFSKDQISVKKEIEKFEKQKIAAMDDGIRWKSKLNDLPAAERQMRGVVVEAELKKSKTGQALLNVIMAQYENSLKLLEM